MIDRVRESTKRVTGCKSLRNYNKKKNCFLSYLFCYTYIITYWHDILVHDVHDKRHTTEFVRSISSYSRLKESGIYSPEKRWQTKRPFESWFTVNCCFAVHEGKSKSSFPSTRRCFRRDFTSSLSEGINECFPASIVMIGQADKWKGYKS